MSNDLGLILKTGNELVHAEHLGTGPVGRTFSKQSEQSTTGSGRNKHVKTNARMLEAGLIKAG